MKVTSTLSNTGSVTVQKHNQNQRPAQKAGLVHTFFQLAGKIVLHFMQLVDKKPLRLPSNNKDVCTTEMSFASNSSVLLPLTSWHDLPDDRVDPDPPDRIPLHPPIQNTAFTSTVSLLMNDQSLLNRLLSVSPQWRSNAESGIADRQGEQGITWSGLSRRPVSVLCGLMLTLLISLAGATGAVGQSIDLSVRQTAVPKKPILNGPVGYTIVVKNAGFVAATNVVVRDSLPTGGTTFNSLAVLRGAGVTNTNTTDFINISIPSIAPNDSVVLDLKLTVLEQGVWFNKVEITAAAGTDIDSEPGNHSLLEDDYDATCFAVPLTWYDGDEFTVAIPSGYTDIKWYRNGTLLTAATDSAVVNVDGSLTIKGPGAYSFSTTRGGCTTGNCCDIVVVPGPLASLGDFVFEDLNANGIQDPGEKGIAGVPVILYLNRSPILTVDTDVNGLYSFTGLTPGSSNSYVVGFGTPTGYSVTVANVGNDSKDSDADPITGRTESYTLNTNANNLTIDAGFYRPASLGDKVFADNNRNGVQDIGDSPLGGVTVTLYTSGSAIATVITGTDGVYSFTGLTPGLPYVVGFSVPTGYTATSPLSGTDKALDSDLLATGLTASITLASGESNTTVDAGFQPQTTSLGDLVFEDKNGNGIQDAGDTGIVGVKVTLLGGATPLSTVTDANGVYSFTGLIPGIPYSLSFSAPSGYTATLANVGDDSKDSDINPITGLTGSYTLTANTPNLTVDAGYYRPASLGNQVFADNNRNGIRDAGDTPIAGVTVTLYTNGSAIATMITGTDGVYNFTGLVPGIPYVVGFGTPTGYAATSPLSGTDKTIDSDVLATGLTGNIILASGESNITTDAGFQTQTTALGDLVFEDKNGNGIQDAGDTGIVGVKVTLLGGATPLSTVTDVNGVYSFTGLTPGTPYSVSFSAPSGYTATLANVGDDSKDSDINPITGLTGSYTLTNNTPNLTVDAGFYRPASLGDKVFADNNRNGVQDIGDSPLGGVTVTLYTSGSAIATVITGTDGVYSFTGLTPGIPYVVGFGTPTGYTATSPLSGTDKTLDSDLLATGLTASVTLASGESNTTIDAGFLPSVTAQFGQIGDYVWFDYNGDGKQGPITGPNAEPGVPGVKVDLYNASTSTLITSTTTTSDGKYLFDNLASGSYYVKFTSPVGAVFTTQTVPGVPTTMNSDAGADGKTATIILDVTQPISSTARVNLTVDAGIVPRGSIGDYVFRDSNGNGIQDDGPTAGIAGVKVLLLDVKTGLQIDSKFTDVSGYYKFDSLKAGDYQIQFLLPTGEKFSVKGQGSSTALDSDADVTTGLSGTITIDVTQPVTSVARNNTTIDAGILLKCATPVNLVVSASTSICAGGQATLIASTTTTGSQIKWYLQPSGGNSFTTTASGQGLVVNPSVPTTYYVEANSADGCTSNRLSVVVFVTPKPSAPVAPDRVTNTCPKTTVNLTQIQITSQPQTGSVYEFHTTASATSPLVANQTAVTGGQYYLFEKTANGCYSDPKLITIQIIDCTCQNVAGVTVTGPTQAVCAGDTIWVSATLQGSATSVVWSSDGSGKFGTANSTSTYYVTSAADETKGSVLLTATTNDPDGAAVACSPATSAVIVAIKARPSAPVGVACDDTLLCLGSKTKLIGFAPGYSINWYDQSGKLLGTTASGGKLIVTPGGTGLATYYAETVGLNGQCSSKTRTSVTVLVQPCLADLAVDKKVVTAGPFKQGQKVTYSITVSNNGSAAASAVTVSDVLPAALTYTGSTPAGDYNPANGVWTIGSLAVGSNRNLLLEATIVGTGSITNVAVVKSPGNDPSKAQNDTSRAAISVDGCGPLTPPTIYCAVTEICKGEVTTLTARDCAGTVLWSDGQTGSVVTVRPLMTTTYNASCVSGTCKSGKSTDITVTVIDLKQPVIVASSDKVCPGGSVTLTVTGCESGKPEWSEGQIGVASIVVLPTVKTTYTVQCRVNNCLSVPAEKTIDIGTDLPKPTVVCSKTAVCPGESLVLQVQNCTGTPLWSTGETTSTITVSPTVNNNTYSVYCKNGACSSPKSDIYTISIVTPTIPTVVASIDTVCVGGKVTLTASGCVGTVIWSVTSLTGSSITVTPTANQTYYAQCKVGSCLSDRSALKTISVVTPTVPTVSIKPAKPLFCAGESVTLTASGCNGKVYWSTGAVGETLSFVTGETKDYFAYCQIGADCKSANSNTVKVNVGTTGTPPTVTASSLTICNGGSVTLTAGNCAGTIMWSDNQTGASITVLPTAQVNEYYAICKPTSGSACGSPKSATVKITVTTPGTPTVTCSTSVICPGEKVTLTVNNCIGTPTWSTGATTSTIDVSPTVTTGYSVYCKNSTCVSPTSSTYTITVTPAPVPTVVASATSITAGQSVTLTASDCPGTIYWSTGQNGPSIVVQPTGTTTYYAQCKYRSCLGDPSLLIKITVPGSCLAKAGSLTTDTPVLCGAKGKTIQISAKESGGRFVPAGYSVAYVLTKGADLVIQQLGAVPTFTVPGDSAATYTIHTLVYDDKKGDKDYLDLSTVQLGKTKAVDVLNAITAAKVCADLDVKGAPVKIKFIAAPVVTTNTYEICYGGTVSLTATGCNGTVTWFNGYTGPVLTRTLYETSWQRATCTVDGCTSELSNMIDVIVVKPNVPTIASTRLTVCAGESVTLTAVGCENGVVHWSNQATGASILVTPTTALNEFTAKCVIGACSSESSPSIKIEVGSPATPTVSIAGSASGITSTTACFGAPVTLVATGCQVGTYVTWSNNMVGASITITPALSGTYSAQCCSSTNCKSVASNTVSVVVLGKVPQPQTLDRSNTCPFKTVDITKGVVGQPSTTGGVFEYYTDATLSTKVQAPTAIATSGTYYVVEKSGSGCYSLPGVIHVQITECNEPIPCDKNPITVDAGVDASICAAKLYKLNGKTTGTVSSVYWTSNGTGTFSDPFSAAATYTPSLKDIQAGLVSLTLTAKSTNTACPAVSDVMSLSVDGIKTIPVVKVVGSSLFCFGDSVTLEAEAGYNYKWSTKATSQRIVVKNSGSYTVTLLDGKGCSSLPSEPVSITVNAPVPAPLVVNMRNVCPANTVDITTVAAGPAAPGNTYEFRLGPAPVVGLLGNHQVNGPCYVYVYEKTAQGCYSLPSVAEVKIFDCRSDTLKSDVSITKTADRTIVKPGTPVKYTIKVTNNGPALAYNVDVRDILPDGLSLVPGTLKFTLSNGVITKRFDSLAVGKSDSIVFFANVIKKGPILNTATITYADRRDPNAQNNTSSVTVQDTSTTPIRMLVGLSKNLVSAKMTSDSTFDATYAFYVRNYGGSDLTNVSVTDNLTNVFATHTVSNVSITADNGSTLVPNTGYTGKGGNVQLLDSTKSTLAAGAIQSFRMKVSVAINRNDSTRTFTNAAAVSALSSGTLLQDNSVAGADPDPDNDGNPNNNTGATIFTIKPEVPSQLGVALAVVKTEKQPNNSYNVTYKVTVKNFGTVKLTNVSLLDTLSSAFSAPASYSIVKAPTVSSTSGLVPVSNYNGGSVPYFLFSSASTLAAGATDTLTFIVNVLPNGKPGPYYTSVLASAKPENNTVVVRDLSNNGYDPKPEGSLATPVRFDLPSALLGVAKSVGAPTQVGDGVYDIPYTIKLWNLGSVDLKKVQVVDNLNNAFGHGALIVSNMVTVKADSGLTANPNYSGQGLLTNLLIDSLSTLPAGKTRSLSFTVRVNVKNADTLQFNNVAMALAATKDGSTTVRDTSTAGSNADPDNDLDPRNNSAPTPITLNSLPGTHLGLALSVKDTVRQKDGSYNVTYRVVAKNYGTSVLTNVILTDSLSKVFTTQTGARYSLVGPVTSSLGSTLKLNPAFNGGSDSRLTLADSTSKLAIGKADTLSFVINVATTGKTGVFLSTVYGAAKAGTEVVTDLSTNGLNPDLNGNNNPTDNNESEATPLVLPTTELSDIFIPEGFSPNNDGVNDVFVIQGTQGLTVHLEVFNRWGSVVYKNDDYKNDWNGTSNTGLLQGDSQGLPDGTYFYLVKLSDGREYVRYMTINR